MESSRLFEQLSLVWQKIPQQKLSSLVTFALIIYCAHVLSTVVWQLVPVTQDKGRIVAAPITTNANSDSASQFDVSKITRLNLFGEENKKEIKPVAPKPQAQSAPKTRLNVTLAGLVADSTDPRSDSSAAIIESSGGQATYGIGDKVKGTQATVDQIFIDRVILLVGSRYESLMLDGIEYSQTVASNPEEMIDANSKAAASQKVGPAPSKRARDAERKTMDRRNDLELSQSLRQKREQMFDDPKKLMDFIRIRPFRQQGELKGYRLTPGKDPSLFEQVGLKHNDLAININGYDLTDMQQALSVMKELRTLTEANITVMRNDSPVDIILAL